MRVLFTKSHAPGSKLIMWGLEEPCSHIAFEFDDKFVIHSSLFGVELQWSNTFKKHYTIVHELEYPGLALEKEEEIFQGILNSQDDDKYDYGAVAYFGWRGFLYKIFGAEFPQTNKWNEDGSQICTELAKNLPNWIIDTAKIDTSMTSPYKMYKIMLNQRNSAGG